MPASTSMSSPHKYFSTFILVIFTTGVAAGILISKFHEDIILVKRASTSTHTVKAQAQDIHNTERTPKNTSDPIPLPSPAACESDSKRIVISLTAPGTGGHGSYPASNVRAMVRKPGTYDVWDDMLAFTGLSDKELMDRLMRVGRFHFEIEHLFFAPKSSRELAFYYRSSSAYLWANAIHVGIDPALLGLTPADGPILDYSGGVGNNCLGLAKSGIKCIYFGIGLMEFEFAQFRAKRHGLGDMIQFVRPYGTFDNGNITGYQYDPVRSLQVGTTLTEKLGGVFALDVFEHIPDYHIVARHLISLMRVGGKLFEKTPFNRGAKSDTEIHLKASMPLEEAFTGMKYVEKRQACHLWEKE